MIEANLADGRVLQFPDGTDHQVIQNTVKRMIKAESQPIDQTMQPPQPEVINRSDLASPQQIAAAEELERRGRIKFGDLLMDAPKATDITQAVNPMSVAAFEPSQVLPGGGKDLNIPPEPVSEAFETVKNIAEVVPVAETAAEAVTSAYGVPISGLVGLLATPFGLETSKDVMERVQKALIYRPQTESGKELSGAVAYPFEKLEQAAEGVSKPILEAGYPDLAATIKTAILGAPAVLGARKAVKSGAVSLNEKTKKMIRKDIEKAVRPSVAGKKTRSQIRDYHDKAATAVEDIVANREKLDIRNEAGARTNKLPETLDEFSQAIEQRKRQVFEEYDSIAKTADDAGVGVDLSKTAEKLKPITENKTLQDLSPETIEYANKRAEVLQGRQNYSAVETQEAIQFLNQSLEKFYRDPSPAHKGQALVDSLIANDLRKQIDTAISKTTGAEYQALKKKYGALKTIEKDVTHRSIVDARKNNKGLIDFSDIFTGGNVVSGMLRAEPGITAAGVAGKGIASYYKMLNDPNKIVKSMFRNVEKLTKEKPAKLPGVGVVIGTEFQAGKEQSNE